MSGFTWLHVPWWKHTLLCQTTHADPFSSTSRSQQSWCLDSQVLEGGTNWYDPRAQCRCTGKGFSKAVTWRNDDVYIPHRPCFWAVGVLHRICCHGPLWRRTPCHRASRQHCGNVRSTWFAQKTWFDRSMHCNQWYDNPLWGHKPRY